MTSRLKKSSTPSKNPKECSVKASGPGPLARRFEKRTAISRSRHDERGAAECLIGPLTGRKTPDFIFRPSSFEKSVVDRAPSLNSVARVGLDLNTNGFATSWGCNPDGVTRPATCLVLSPDGAECILGSADHAAYIFTTSNGAPVRRLYTRKSGHTDWVSCAAFAGGPGRTVVTGGVDGRIITWRRGSAEASLTLSAEQGPIMLLEALSGASPTVLSGGYDGTICLWDLNVAAHRPTKSRMLQKSNTASSCLQLKLGAEKRGTAGFPPVTAVSCQSIIRDPNHAAVELDPSDRCLEDNDTSTSVANTSLDSHSPPVSRKLMSGCKNGIVSLWDLSEGKCLRPVIGKHQNCVSHIFHGRDDVYYSAAADGRVALWDTRGPLGSKGGDCIGATSSVMPFTCEGKKGGAPVTGLCGVDHQRLVAAGGDGRVCLLDTRYFQSPQYMDEDRSRDARGSVKGGHSDSPIGSLCLHPSGRVCFSGGMYDDWVVGHDIDTLKPLYGLDGQGGTASYVVATWGRVVVSGDQGNASVFTFN